MLALLRRISIRARLLIAAGGTAVTLIAVATVGALSLSSATGATQRSNLAADHALAAEHLTYLAADWNGWQTAYALDAVLDPAVVADDTGPSRAAFLAASDALTAGLGEFEADTTLDPDEVAWVADARAGFDAFMAADQEVIAAYRSGDAQAQAHATDLVLTDEIENYQAVADAFGSLADELAQHASAAEDDALATAATGKTTVLVISLTVVALLATLVPLLVLSVTRPAGVLRDRMEDISHGEGDLTARLDATGRDELAGVAVAFNRFAEQIAGVIRSVAGSAASVAAAAEQMAGTSTQIGSAAQESAVQAGAVAAAAEQVSANVQTVASGAEQMGASIHEISQNASEAARVAARAASVAENASRTVATLGESSRRIGDVVKVITQIAEQTNLLALNATIEAARAGDAGKGFAVVAGEVKELAQETAKATEDISRRVEAIQADTGGAVTAIAEISGIVAQVNDYQMTIASAVEEQTATTNEMSRSVAEAAAGASEIAQNVTGVATAASMTTEGVEQSAGAIAELAQMAAELQTQVGRFRV